MREKNNNKISCFWWLARKWRRHGVGIILIIGFLTFVFAAIGTCPLTRELNWSEDAGVSLTQDLELPEGAGKALRDWSVMPYRIAQIFLLNFSAQDIGNWFTALASILAAGFMLMSIATFLMYAFDSLRLRKLDLLRWTLRRRHIVICGLGRIGSTLAAECANRVFGRCTPLVIIDKGFQKRKLQTCREKGAIVLQGDATDRELLVRARAHKAERVFFVTRSDTDNIKAAMDLRRIGGREGPVCHIHITDPLQARMVEEACLWEGDCICRESPKIQIFDIFRSTSRQFAAKHLLSCFPQEDQIAHYVLLGFGPMGQELALQTVRQAHFPSHKRSRMTVFDHDMETRKSSFLIRNPAFCPEPGTLDLSNPSERCDDWDCSLLRPCSAACVADEYRDIAVEYACNAEFKEMPPGVKAAEFREVLHSRLEKPQVKGAVIVCFEDERRNFETALRLKDLLWRNRMGPLTIFVWLPRLTALADLVDSAHKKKAGPEEQAAGTASVQVTAFGRAEEVCGLDTIIQDRLSKTTLRIHEAHRRLVAMREPERAAAKTIPSWEMLSPDHQESNRQQYDHMDIKLRAMGCSRTAAAPKEDIAIFEFTDSQIETLAKMEHNRWMAERLLAGYRYAPSDQRDDRARLHPDLVPWEKLRDSAKEYDCKAASRLPSLLRELGQKVVRNG